MARPTKMSTVVESLKRGNRALATGVGPLLCIFSSGDRTTALFYSYFYFSCFHVFIFWPRKWCCYCDTSRLLQLCVGQLQRFKMARISRRFFLFCSLSNSFLMVPRSYNSSRRNGEGACDKQLSDSDPIACVCRAWFAFVGRALGLTLQESGRYWETTRSTTAFDSCSCFSLTTGMCPATAARAE